jgi:LysR family transcriptional regulator, transcriptional activator for leuABCD operon
MFNLRSVDLNLLPVFEAAYEERSLSRAAVRLAMTQPAVSHALSRLRAVFRDELFVRLARGVAPTPAADAIYARLRGALGTVRDAVSEARGFDAATSIRRFFVTIPHPLGPILALALQQRLRKAAPHTTIEFSTRSRPIDLERGLREGRVDAAVDWLSPHDAQYREALLFDDGIVAVARRGHVADRARNARDLVATVRFVTLREREVGVRRPEGIGAWYALQPDIALKVSEWLEVLLVAGKSDLIGLVPRSLERIGREIFDVHALRATSRAPAIPIKLIWHASRERDPAHLFLRKQVTEAARSVI